MSLLVLKKKQFLEHFTKNNCKKGNQKEFKIEKNKKIKKKQAVNCMLNVKPDILLIVGLIQKTQYKWVNIFYNQNLSEKQ